MVGSGLKATCSRDEAEHQARRRRARGLDAHGRAGLAGRPRACRGRPAPACGDRHGGVPPGVARSRRRRRGRGRGPRGCCSTSRACCRRGSRSSIAPRRSRPRRVRLGDLPPEQLQRGRLPAASRGGGPARSPSSRRRPGTVSRVSRSRRVTSRARCSRGFSFALRAASSSWRQPTRTVAVKEPAREQRGAGARGDHPGAGLAELARIAAIRRASGGRHENQVVFLVDGVVLTTRRIDGQFPEHQAVAARDVRARAHAAPG